MQDVRQFKEHYPAFPHRRVLLTYESSRGCWWAKRSGCKFCGISSEDKSYRAKHPDRVLALIRDLRSRYRIRRFFATDPAMPLSFFKTLLPAVANHPDLKDVELFYDIRTNVKRRWLNQLHGLAIRYVQAGIESFSTHLLDCLDKGTTGLQNIYFLKLCRMFGIWPSWCFLFCIPGETRQDYDDINAMIPKIVHYHPPVMHMGRLQLLRYTRYFLESERFVRRFEPKAWYRGLFPKDKVDIEKAAYYFNVVWKDTIGQSLDDYPDLSAAVTQWIQIWRSARQLPGLYYNSLENGSLILNDTRFGQVKQHSLKGLEAAVYRCILDPVAPRDIAVSITENGHPTQEDVSVILNLFVDQGTAIAENNLYMGLALPDRCRMLPQPLRQDFFKRTLR